jgi:hypothetical protein
MKQKQKDIQGDAKRTFRQRRKSPQALPKPHLEIRVDKLDIATTAIIDHRQFHQTA